MTGVWRSCGGGGGWGRGGWMLESERELSESGGSGMLLEVQRGGVPQREGRGYR